MTVAKKKAKKKAPKKSVATKKVAEAPAKKVVNKSQVIRDYAAKHPKAGPTEITRELAKQGVKVSPPLVSNVLGAAKRKKSKRRVAKKGPGRPAAVASDKVSLDALVNTSKFVEQVGGVDKAKALIKAIEKLG